MCIIEYKTYIDADGEWTVETPRPCHRATSTHLCSQVVPRNIGPIRIVEAAPKPRRERNSSDSSTAADGFNFGGRAARDISAGSSNRSSARGSTIMSEPSYPSSASSPSFVEVKPKVPTPPSAASASPHSERMRAPWPPPSSPPVAPTSPPDPRKPVPFGGTAIYERPPPLDLPRAYENERSRRPEPSRGERRSSMKEVDDPIADESAPRPRRKPTISIDTTLQPSVSSSSTNQETKRQSDTPRPGILRHRSTKDSSRRDSKQPDRQRTAAEERLREAERERHRQEEEEDQASLERERLAASERRQSAREERAREDSRTRSIRKAHEKLEGLDLDDDPVDTQVEADLAQMAREREAAARRRDSMSSHRTSYAEDPAPLRRRESDARGSNRRSDGRTSPTATRTRRTNTDGSDPPSPTLTRPSPFYPVTVHQPSYRERGEDIIAREQARRSRAERDAEEYERGGERYNGSGQESGRRRRKDERRRK